MKEVKIDIISGFLGAGKTTLIKKLIAEAFPGEKVVLIENEFGEIGVDQDFLSDAGIEIKEINSGCICCSLVGDFEKALEEVIKTYEPDRIIIEPSGVGKLSDVIKSVENIKDDRIRLNSASTVVDSGKAKMYNRNFGEFFNNQIQSAGTVILSRTQLTDDSKVMDAAEIVQGLNEHCSIITTEWDKLDGKKILLQMEGGGDLIAMLMDEIRHPERHYHDHGDGNFHYHDDEGNTHEAGEDEHDHDHDHEHHHDHDHDHDHEHEHHHDHDHEHEHDHDHDHDHDHEHHHDHDHDHEHKHDHDHDHEHEHEHDHDHDHDHEHHHDHDHDHEHGDSCGCGHDHGHDHHHHAADEVFTSWGIETPATIKKEDLEKVLDILADETTCGTVLRAKGMLPDDAGNWYFFDVTPGEVEIRDGVPETTGKIVVVGTDLDIDKIRGLFGV